MPPNPGLRMAKTGVFPAHFLPERWFRILTMPMAQSAFKSQFGTEDSEPGSRVRGIAPFQLDLCPENLSTVRVLNLCASLRVRKLRF